jgi:hypothetical protein
MKHGYPLTASVIVVTFGLHATMNLKGMPQEPTPRPIANVWSEPINGLSGRLRIEFEDLRPGLRHAVYLELRNHSVNPVAVTNQPRVNAELFDVAGKPVSSSDFPLSGPIPNPQWALIPRDAYLGFRIDMQTVGVPTREQGMALIAIGGKSWGLRAGEYVLKAALVFKKEDGAPQDQWIGELELPPIDVVVTTQMLAVN